MRDTRCNKDSAIKGLPRFCAEPGAEVVPLSRDFSFQLEVDWLAHYRLGRMSDDARRDLTAAREQVRHTIERLDEIRADLEATAAGLRLPEAGEDVDGPLAGLYELDAVIRCSLHDHLKPLISSLRSLLATQPEEQP